METKAFADSRKLIGRSFWQVGLAFCFACCVALIVVHPVWAKDFTVNTQKDGVDSDLTDGLCLNITVVPVVPEGTCTLRAAIQQANATPLVADVIHLPKGTYRLTIKNLLDMAEDEAA